MHRDLALLIRLVDRAYGGDVTTRSTRAPSSRLGDARLYRISTHHAVPSQLPRLPPSTPRPPHLFRLRRERCFLRVPLVRPTPTAASPPESRRLLDPILLRQMPQERVTPAPGPLAVAGAEPPTARDASSLTVRWDPASAGPRLHRFLLCPRNPPGPSLTTNGQLHTLMTAEGHGP
jgi:hypothetical protein